jgi:non-ribosomal peptide synthase protein (TIGR01720 family)
MDELNDDIDVAAVYRILNEINYDEESFFADPDDRQLAAYYTSNKTLTVSELKSWLGMHLPAAMVPGFFIQIDELPLTENGKIDRTALPAPREQRPQLEQAYCAPRTDLEESLTQIWCDALGIKRIGIYDNYFDLGGDSIVAIQMVGRANAAGILLAPNELFLHQTIAELAAVARVVNKPVSQQPMEPGPVPLTPIQHWFFAQQPAQPDHFNQSVLLHVDAEVDARQLQRALQLLHARHDALRLRFWQQNGDWKQALPDKPASIKLLRVMLPDDDSQSKNMMQQAERHMHESLKLAEGRLVAATLFEAKGGQQRQLLLIAHHLVVDAVSWLFLLEDLDTACKQLADQQAVNLPAMTSSCRSWAIALQQDADSQVTRQEQRYWSSISERQTLTPPQEPPEVQPEADILESTRRCKSVILPATQTQRLLNQASSVWHMQMHEVMLAALGMTLTEHIGKQNIEISLESHGREDINADIDTTRTVGWFTALYPVALTIDASLSLDETMRHVRQTLRKVPRHGIGYGLLAYLAQNHQQQPTTPLSTNTGGVLMNYMGRTSRLLRDDSWFKFTRPLSVSRAAKNHICFNWEINAWLGEDGLHIDWDYSDALYDESEIIQIAEALLSSLCSIAEYSVTNTAETSSSEDFPLAGLDQDQLDKLTALLNKD